MGHEGTRLGLKPELLVRGARRAEAMRDRFAV